MMFQEPAAELFDRSRAIIHGKISYAVLVRIKFQTLIVPHLLPDCLNHIFFRKHCKISGYQSTLWNTSKGAWEPYQSYLIVRVLCLLYTLSTKFYIKLAILAWLLDLGLCLVVGEINHIFK
jgi:hypothetical protein